MNILYVDDEPNNLVSFRAAFRRHYKVHTAESGKEGIEILKDHDIPIIITDQKMPEMTGVEFLEQVVVDFPNSIRMVLTGFSDVDAIIQAINSGQVFKYITKPWDENYLKMTIDRAVEFFETQQENRDLILKLKQKVDEQEKIVEERTREVVEQSNRITDSIKYAKRIQDALLKKQDYESKHLPEHFIIYKPKDIVSGDFYWALEKENYLYLAAVDCTGHGVPGAFLTLLGANLLNEINSTSQLLTPSQILDNLSLRVIKELSQDDGESKDGMDISLLRIDLDTNEINWSGANSPLYLLLEKEEEVKVIKGNKQPIGFSENVKPFTNHKLKLNSGDLIYLFSDGFPDQFGGENGKKIGYKVFRDFLVKISKQKISKQKNSIIEFFEEWKGEEEQTDDVCLIGLKIK